MCILLCTRDIRGYRLVLGSNRDEFFERPTQPAGFQTTDTGKSDIFMPIDLGRPEHGTWMGITRDGRICVLVNYKEPPAKCVGAVSRGVMARDFLEHGVRGKAEEWVHAAELRMADEGFVNVGGFSLLFGDIDGDLWVLSNRGPNKLVKVLNKKSIGDDGPLDHRSILGLSNSAVNEPWPKVLKGVAMFEEVIAQAQSVDEIDDEWLISRVNTVMRTRCGAFSQEQYPNLFIEAMDAPIGDERSLASTIFVPPLKAGDAGLYGTRTQCVVLVKDDGTVIYAEENRRVSFRIEHH